MDTLSNRLFNQRVWEHGLKKSTILGVVLALLMLFAGKGQIVHAASITVTTTDDELNGDGDCSLREAIQAANTDTAVDACFAGSGADTIILPAGIYTLSIPVAEEVEEYDNEQGDLDIGSDVTIQGDGAATTILDGAGLDPTISGARVLQIIAGQVQVSGVTIRNGVDGHGGGIANNGALTLTNSTIADNNAEIVGGGIFNDGTLAIYDSTISSNSATGWGAGIHNGGAGTLTIEGSTIANNSSSQFAGGIRNDGTLTISNSTIAGNRADDAGGGIANLGSLTLTNSTISSNSALLYAGGILNMGDIGGGVLTVTGSSFTGNVVDEGPGGAILNEVSSLVTIHDSTFEDNRSSGNGAGIANFGTLAIHDSKIKGNSTNVDGGGLYNGSDLGSAGTITISDSKIEHNGAERGGGIFNDGGTLDIYDSMIKTNTASFTGGGIFNNGGMVTLTNSKVRNNQPDNCVGC